MFLILEQNVVFFNAILMGDLVHYIKHVNKGTVCFTVNRFLISLTSYITQLLVIM